MGGEVVVQEELTSHDEEGDVMGSPCDEEVPGRVVQLRASAVVQSVDPTTLGDLVRTDDTGKDGKKGRR